MREGEMMSKNETDGIRNARERARESAESKETFVGLTDSRGRSIVLTFAFVLHAAACGIHRHACRRRGDAPALPRARHLRPVNDALRCRATDPFCPSLSLALPALRSSL